MGQPSACETDSVAERVRRVLFMAMVGAIGLLLSACQTESLPELVTVKEVSPRQVEQRDRMEVRGTGFPEGRLARIELVGTVLRAGRTPEPHVTAVAEGRVISSERIEVDVTESFLSEVGGGSHLSSHATFRGRLVASFPAVQPGAPPVTGQLRDVTLDVVPPKADPSELARRSSEAAAFARGVGLEFGERTTDGLSVATVHPGSRADEAGIVAGDVLLELDGVSLLDASDFITVDELRASVLVKSGEHRTTRPLDVRGLGRPTLESASFAYAVAGGAALLLCVLFAPLSFVGARGTRPRLQSSPGLAALGRAVANADRGAILLVFASAAACLVVLSGAFPFDGDALALLLAPIGLDLALAFGEARVSAIGRATRSALVLHAPLVAVGVAASYVAGSTRASELSAIGYPWPSFLRSLPMLVLFIVMVASRARVRRALACRAPILLDGAADALYATTFVLLFAGGSAPGGAAGVLGALSKIAVAAALTVALRALVRPPSNPRLRDGLRDGGMVLLGTSTAIGLSLAARAHGRFVLPMSATWVLVALSLAGAARIAIVLRARSRTSRTEERRGSSRVPASWMDTLPDPFL